jgi:hypothetical protein
MTRPFIALLALFLFGVAAPAPAWAGGDGYDELSEPEGVGNVFFGVVRDTRGIGMSGVEVKLQPKTGDAVALKTNILGLYRGRMSKDMPVEDIEVMISKPGYTVRNIVRRQGQNRDILVETNCTLQK